MTPSIAVADIRLDIVPSFGVGDHRERLDENPDGNFGV